MAYTLEHGEPVPKAVRRIARQQLDGALEGLADPSRLGIEQTVHDVRKRCKKVRALARLVRQAVGGDGFRSVNEPVRDAAAELSPMRDSHALLATFERLVATNKESLGEATVGPVRAELQRQADAASPTSSEGAQRIERAAALLTVARAASQEWRLHDSRVLERGVRRIYGRGRTALRDSRASDDVELRHEWRKREKDLWYAIRLLEPAAPSVLVALEARLGELAEALGDDHDLAVLGDALRAQPHAYGGILHADQVIQLADRTAADLQTRAYRLGATLYAEPPRAFGRRIGEYWQNWHDLGDERQVGGIDVLDQA